MDRRPKAPVERHRRSWFRCRRVLLAVAATASCSGDVDEFNGYGIDEVEPGLLWLYSECPPGTADVDETDAEVRISVDAELSPNDCLDRIELTLGAPIGRRKILVDGREWVRTDHTTCHWEYGPDRGCD